MIQTQTIRQNEAAPPPSMSPQSAVTVATTRPRQTKPPPSPFRDVLAGSVTVLMSGARIATHVLGVPTLAAAVQDARVAGGSPAAAGASALAAGGGGSELATMHAMQRESQAFNLQLLELQEQVQQENRRFTTVSNVLRAKHDTAKAAVSNIRG
jgi:hypothetical protein